MRPLTPAQLPPPSRLTRRFFRGTSPHLDDARFAAKWATAFESPLRFFRAFPAAYYRDLAAVPATHLASRSLVGFGDAHPENFGFVVAGGRTHFVFNDFDDSGFTDAGVDALRWFTAHRLWTRRPRETDALIARYVAVLRAPGRVPAVPKALVPAPEKVLAKQAKKFIEGDRLVRSSKTKLSNSDRHERAVVTRGLTEHGSRVLDVAERERDHGGSGGLRRYWALVQGSDGARDVLELKELSEPATASGPGHQPLHDRLVEVREALWAGVPAEDHFLLRLFDAPFLARSRLRRANLDLDELTPAQLERVLAAEVGLLARHHAEVYEKTEAATVGRWLRAGSRLLAARWAEAYARLAPRAAVTS
jgi:hypothetical protein